MDTSPLRTGRSSVFIVCLAFVVVGSLLVAAGLGTAAAPLGTALADTSDEPDRHQHPDEYADDRGVGATIDWLSNELSSRLGDSAVSISEGQYDLGRSVLGEEYDDRLGQFFELTDDETTEDEPSAGDAYEDAADTQERLAELIEEYHETFTEYEAARDAGDDERARELARELEALATEIDELGGELDDAFEIIEEETETDLSDPRDTINETTGNVSNDQETVRNEQFIGTALAVEDVEEPVSLLDPGTVTGTLEAADNSTLDAGDGELVVAGQPIEFEIDSDGTITFAYRPAPTTDLATEAVTVRYVPATQSAYLGSEATMAVSLEQTAGEIIVDEHTDAVAYTDSLRVSGAIQTATTLTDDVPLVVQANGDRLGEVTAKNGTVNGTVPIPATLIPGEHTLSVALATDGHALGADAGETTVSVTESATELTVEAEHDAGELAVVGSLETEDGTPIVNQSVEIGYGGETHTVETDEEGTFNTTGAIPADLSGDLAVEATFDGTGTNLASTNAEMTVGLSTAGGGLPTGTIVVTLLGVGAVVGGAGLVWYRRRGTTREEPGSERNPLPPADTTSADPPAAGATTETLLSLAHERHDSGESGDAVRIGYAAVRRAYGDAVENATALTHWEFYRRVRADADADHLRAVTEGYERAVFTPESVPGSDVADVLASVRTLCERAEGPAASGGK